MEEACGRPMLYKEYKGISQVSHDYQSSVTHMIKDLGWSDLGEINIKV